jgi:tetratricopeptide (TPR) repeat protein
MFQPLPAEKPFRIEIEDSPSAPGLSSNSEIEMIEPENGLPENIEEDISPEQQAIKLYKRAKYLLLQDRTSETVRLLEECVKLDPQGLLAYDSWLLLGRLRLANPAWAMRAMDALQAANNLRPKAGEPFALMGELYYRKGFKREAAQNYRKAIELNPLLPIPQEVDMTDADEVVEAPTPKPTFWRHVMSWWDPTKNP